MQRLFGWQRFRMDTGPNVVRKVPLSLAVSIGVHGTLLGIGLAYAPFATTDPPRTLPQPVAIEVISTPVASTESIIPVDVSFVPVDAVASTTERATERPTEAAAVATSTRGTERSGSTRSGTGTPTGTGTTDGTSKNPWLDMRKGKRDRLSVDGAFTSFDPSAGPGPEKQIRTGQIAQDGGTHRSDQGVFTAKVEKDGNVSLHDAKNVSLRLALPTPKLIGRGVTDWYDSDKGDDGQRGKRTLQNEVGGSIDQGNEALNDKGDRSRAVVVPVLRGGFDVTDGLMRAAGVGDPYASKKLAFLDSTRDERAQIGAKYRAGQLAQTDILVRKNLEMLWTSVADLAERKQALFELWDEAVETGDGKVVEAGAAARRQIVGFIRAKLPAGSPHAFTARELVTLNGKRQSQQPFAPYD